MCFSKHSNIMSPVIFKNKIQKPCGCHLIVQIPNLPGNQSATATMTFSGFLPMYGLLSMVFLAY